MNTAVQQQTAKLEDDFTGSQHTRVQQFYSSQTLYSYNATEMYHMSFKSNAGRLAPLKPFIWKKHLHLLVL